MKSAAYFSIYANKLLQKVANIKFCWALKTGEVIQHYSIFQMTEALHIIILDKSLKRASVLTSFIMKFCVIINEGSGFDTGFSLKSFHT